MYDTYERPHRRISPSFPDTVIPYTKQKEDHYIAIYVDMSGSIGPEELARFMGVIEKAPAEIHFLGFSFDSRIYEWDMKSRPLGGGGTRFDEVVRHAENLPKKMDAYVVLTDGYDSSPNPKVPRKWMWVYTDVKLESSAGHSVKMPALRSHRTRSSF